LFQARRADIELFARDLEARGRARATITRRLCTVAGFYRYAVEEELLEHSPVAHVRRPRLDYESHAIGLDRNELGALLVAAGLGPPGEHALISLLALNGLRVSEATGADIQALGEERGHRTLVVTREGGKVVTIPLAPRTPRAIDLAISERSDGPIFLTADGRRLDRHERGVSSAISRGGPGSPSQSGRTRCGTRSSPQRWTLGCRCGMCRKPRLTLIRGPRCAREGPDLAGPARHVHRRRLRRRSSPVKPQASTHPPGWEPSRADELRTQQRVTDRDVETAPERMPRPGRCLCRRPY
jgi:hypothetical protein